MPLVYTGRDGSEPVTEAHERARRIKPQYTGGELVKVAGGRNLAEAELVQGILLDQGIPSVQRRTRGFDVPDFLAAGPRDILVSEAAAQDALALLTDADLGPSASRAGRGARPRPAPRRRDADRPDSRRSRGVGAARDLELELAASPAA